MLKTLLLNQSQEGLGASCVSVLHQLHLISTSVGGWCDD